MQVKVNGKNIGELDAPPGSLASDIEILAKAKFGPQISAEGFTICKTVVIPGISVNFVTRRSEYIEAMMATTTPTRPCKKKRPATPHSDRQAHRSQMDEMAAISEHLRAETGRIDTLLDVIRYFNETRDEKEYVRKNGRGSASETTHGRPLDPEEVELYGLCLKQLKSLVGGGKEDLLSEIDSLKSQLAAANEAVNLGGWDVYKGIKDGSIRESRERAGGVT